MERKRFLKIFESKIQYEELKNEIMGIPHIVLFDDSNEIFIQKTPFEKKYFTIESLDKGTFTISLPQSFKYKFNNEEWVETSETVTINMEIGDTIQISHVADVVQQSIIGKSCKFNVYGNIMSLLYGDDFEGQTDLSGKDRAFYMLFSHCDTLQNAENLILPATTLASSCYSYMFSNCTSLETAPQLPATELAEGCYTSMFFNCTSLTTALELPATTLAQNCCEYMFYGCTSLTSAPELPATTLANGCYSNMFRDCTSLTSAPELPATTLANGCYQGMFEGCTSLTTAPQLLATELAYHCYYKMFYGCTSLTSAPELIATTLKDGCYMEMFNGCSKLNYIKMLATNINVTECLYNWVNGVADKGTFVKHPQLQSWTKGSHGIPKGWSVENGYVYVDLGLPSGTLWATSPIMNIEGQPLYFQWGDTEGYTQDQIEIGEKVFNLENYKWFDSNSQTFTKYNTTDRKTFLDREDDAAYVHMGGDWFIPSGGDIDELTQCTTVTWTTQNGVNGKLFSSKINEQSLFIPALGGSPNNTIVQFNQYGYLWLDDMNINDESSALSYTFSQEQTIILEGLKSQGRSIIGVKRGKD